MAEPHAILNQLELTAARAQLSRCCGATRWVSAMLARRPFASTAELKQQAQAIWDSLSAEDYREAFTHHPEIGANLAALREKFAATAGWSSAEQQSVGQASEATLEALRDENLAYKARFGFIFIVCATGKSADEMLGLLRARLANEPTQELLLAAAEQAKITALRLDKLAP